MKAEQLLVKQVPGYVMDADDVAKKLAELIDAHNKLVYHIFAAPDSPVSTIDLVKHINRDYFGKPPEVPLATNCDKNLKPETRNALAVAAYQVRKSEEIRFVHNLLIAWGKVCNHIDNEVTEVVTGVFKCETCGLPYIPTGD